MRQRRSATASSRKSGEKAIPEAHLLSLSVRYELRSGLALQVAARNLLDEEYFNSADDSVPMAPGRSVGLSLSWTDRPAPE